MFNNLSILLISLGEIPYFSELVYQISLQYHGVQSCLSKTSRSVRKSDMRLIQACYPVCGMAY